MKTRIVPPEWMPECVVTRVVLHWTCGGHKANSVDRSHYHLLLEGDGRLVRGDHSLADNMSVADGDYAAHTRGLNSRVAGISMCCMAGTVEKPFRPGPYPMTRAQFDAAVLATADVCERYGVPVTRQTVLGHGEVQGTLGIAQRGKWDPMVLPFLPEFQRLSYADVGDYIRRRVAEALEPPATVAVRVEAPGVPSPGWRTFTGSHEARTEDGNVFVALRPLASALGWLVESAGGGKATVRTREGVTLFLGLDEEDGDPAKPGVQPVGFVRLRELADEWPGASLSWDAATKTALFKKV